MANYEPRSSTQAVVFGAWFSAAVSLDDASVQRDFGLTKYALVERFKIGVETALSKAKFLKTTRVETIQAFVMYMVSHPSLKWMLANRADPSLPRRSLQGSFCTCRCGCSHG